MKPSEALAAFPQVISYDEWWRVWSYANMLDISDVEGHSLWLAVDNGRRSWHYENSHNHFEIFGEASPGTPDFALAVSPRVVDFGSDLSTSADPAVLSCVDGTSLMVASSRGSIVFDMPHDTSLQWWHSNTHACTAVVDAQSLRDVLHCIRTLPRGFKLTDYGPPIWCVIGNGEVKFHADWSRYGFGRSTASVPARTEGSAQFHSGISQTLRLLSCTDTDGSPDVTIYVDPPDGHGCTVVSGEWRMTAQFVDAVAATWSGALWTALRIADITYEKDGETAAEFVVRGAQVRASLHAGVVPVCRISNVIAREVDCSADLLVELNAVNAKFAGINLWWENDMIVAVSDIEMAHISEIGEKARRLVDVSSSLGPLLALL